MGRIIHLFFWAGLAAVATGCATPYMSARGRDVADIFTASVGKGFGVKARVGPAQLGVIEIDDIYGLRGGQFYTCDHEIGRDICLVMFGIEAFGCPCTESASRGKEFGGIYCFVPTPLHFMCGEPFYSPSYWTQIEATVGVGGSVRLGFNPGELLDFILGWTTIDIYGDDQKRQRQKSNKVPEPSVAPAPQVQH